MSRDSHRTATSTRKSNSRKLNKSSNCFSISTYESTSCKLLSVRAVLTVCALLFAANQNVSSSRPRSAPAGSSCLLSAPVQVDKLVGSKQLMRADEHYDKLVQVSQNSVQLLVAANEQRLSQHRSSQLAFESICSGWRNSLDGREKRPPAFWALDVARAALVAKFIYHDPDLADISEHEARLSSPIFPPIPAYHSRQSSRHFSSCKLAFRTYITIPAHLELHLVQLASDSRRARDSHLLHKIVEGKSSRRPKLDPNAPEAAAWQDHLVALPHNMTHNSRYLLEFSTISGPVSTALIRQHKHLQGVAIANFSLAPQCFGLEVDPNELDQINVLDSSQNYLDEPVKTSDDQANSQSLDNRLFVLASSCTLLVLALLLIRCLLVRAKSNRLANFWLSRLCCCWSARANKSRVYVQGQNGKQVAGQEKLDEQLRSNKEHYLRPLQNVIFDNMELKENPNYLSNGIQPLISKSIPLEPYQINRKRLTLTSPLGKGAFGEVYQGYLVCYCTDDEKNLAAGQDEESADSDSHSIKVAVKTLTDERSRMTELDFIQEAHNMSMVEHRNIVKLIGVCFEEKPFYIIMELLQGGNLKNFLLKNRDKSQYQSMASQADQAELRLNMSSWSLSQQQQFAAPNRTSSNMRLCMGDLLVFALDIARACDYLQKRKFIHRDLAARNCLLTSSTRVAPSGARLSQNGALNSPQLLEAKRAAQQSPRPFVGSPPSALDVNANHKVDISQVFLNGFMDSSMVAKLADFGMTRDVYSNDYYRVGHREMPGKNRSSNKLLNPTRITV